MTSSARDTGIDARSNDFDSFESCTNYLWLKAHVFKQRSDHGLNGVLGMIVQDYKAIWLIFKNVLSPSSPTHFRYKLSVKSLREVLEKTMDRQAKTCSQVH